MRYSARYKLAKAFNMIASKEEASRRDAVANMKQTIASLDDGGVAFAIAKASNGDWYAESINISGIITGGTKDDNIDEMIEDAILTYFQIPPELCAEGILYKEGKKPVAKTTEVFATA